VLRSRLLGTSDIGVTSLPAVVRPATVNRIATGLRAALNLLADHDDTIANRRAWETGLAAIRGATQTRNVILPEAVIR
jgi:hypothetical protein